MCIFITIRTDGVSTGQKSILLIKNKNGILLRWVLSKHISVKAVKEIIHWMALIKWKNKSNKLHTTIQHFYRDFVVQGITLAAISLFYLIYRKLY